MLRTAAQKALAAIAYTVVLLSAIPASAEDNLESRIQTLEQELKLIKELLQPHIMLTIQKHPKQ